MRENQSFFATLIIVALAASAAALLLVVALVVWLAELMGSIVYPCLILGVLLAALATIIYKVSLRQTMRQTEEHLGVIYDVAKIVNSALQRLFAIADLFMGNRNGRE